MIPVSKPYIGEAEKQAVMEVLDSGMLASGPRTAKFEERFAQMCGVKHAIGSGLGRAGVVASDDGAEARGREITKAGKRNIDHPPAVTTDNADGDPPGE